MCFLLFSFSAHFHNSSLVLNIISSSKYPPISAHRPPQVHIDFGFILGRDPKPMQPPFKLSKEMVDAMGGSQSRRYEVFKEYCCQVSYSEEYLHLLRVRNDQHTSIYTLKSTCIMCASVLSLNWILLVCPVAVSMLKSKSKNLHIYLCPIVVVSLTRAAPTGLQHSAQVV